MIIYLTLLHKASSANVFIELTLDQWIHSSTNKFLGFLQLAGIKWKWRMFVVNRYVRVEDMMTVGTNLSAQS